MAKCKECKGTGKCLACGGTGNWKTTDSHPNSHLVNSDTGGVKCGSCLGKGYCERCRGTGEG